MQEQNKIRLLVRQFFSLHRLGEKKEYLKYKRININPFRESIYQVNVQQVLESNYLRFTHKKQLTLIQYKTIKFQEVQEINKSQTK